MPLNPTNDNRLDSRSDLGRAHNLHIQTLSVVVRKVLQNLPQGAIGASLVSLVSLQIWRFKASRKRWWRNLRQIYITMDFLKSINGLVDFFSKMLQNEWIYIDQWIVLFWENLIRKPWFKVFPIRYGGGPIVQNHPVPFGPKKHPQYQPWWM